MKTKAVRLYGENDLRLEEFELPAIKSDEILMKVVSDSLCMSSYKAATQGARHKRVPDDVANNPIIIGHEFCGELVEIGDDWKNKYQVGQKVTIQPAIPNNGYSAPVYSYNYCGGDATYIILPPEAMREDAILPYNGDGFFCGSLSEPSSCVIGAYHANYHTELGVYEHKMGIVEGGKLALLASVGPMGLAAIDYAIHADRKPSVMVVTDIDDARLERAASIFTVEEAAKNGIKLTYINTGKCEDPVKELMDLSDGTGYNDVVVFAPVPALIEQADDILAHDGCLNFFSGPSNPQFKAPFNFYDVHYDATHIVGTSGGNTDDMKESLKMMAEGKLTAAALVTHVGGLNSVVDATLNLPKIPGGKKLIYTHIDLPLTAITEFEEKGKDEPIFAELAKMVAKTNGLWNAEAEAYLLENAKKI